MARSAQERSLAADILARVRSLDPLILDAVRDVDQTLLDWTCSLTPGERLRACYRAGMALDGFDRARSPAR